ncbi:MAG: type IV pilus assembly protein PilM, partial [Deltaproteobacteria bacterium]|nr:type IV pilus assembly protein PilM [Deltaproteobacteria bacterium]
MVFDFFKKSNLVGLDIGSNSVKIIRLRESAGGISLLNFDVAILPRETVVDGTIMNFTLLVDKIKELVRVNNLKNQDCILAVSGNSVIIKKISLPEMSTEELEDSIQWEAEQYIPFDIKDVNVDFQILNPRAGHGQMDVLLVAAKKDIINDYVSISIEAGLNPSVVDVATFSVQNMFELNYGFPSGETIALINSGASHININVIANGVTSFTRDISMGGSALTEEIQKQLNVTWEEAEQFKIGHEGSVSSSTITKEVSRISERITETMTTEIQRSLP